MTDAVSYFFRKHTVLRDNLFQLILLKIYFCEMEITFSVFNSFSICNARCCEGPDLANYRLVKASLEALLFP